MQLDPLVSIALVIGLGMIGQWIAWRFRMPSILFLLGFGLLVGPFYELLSGVPFFDVEDFLGELLFPVVSASVAIILFEGGLSLRISDIRGSSGVVRNLVSISVLASWIISAVAAHYLFNMSWNIALLLGATLVVTGPTVIIPLLKQIRPKGRVNSILRWEAIIIDPVGAVLAVLVFEDIIVETSLLGAVWLLIYTLLIGLGIGVIVANIMVELYRRYWVPDSLQNPVTLGFVLAAFAASNVLQAESGLLTVTVMGIVMANQKRFDIRHIVEFKETLQLLLLSVLFILLAARMTAFDLLQIGVPTLIFILIIVFIQRPLGVWISTLGTDLDWREKLFLSWMAPRGIVAAAVSSIFALEITHLVEEGASIPVEDVGLLVPITFAVIISTVGLYSLTGGFLARRLGLAEQNPQGLLIVGGSRWIRQMALEVQKAGFRVLLTDTNQRHIDIAASEGLEVYHGSILSEVAQDEINFGGIGRLLAMTSNSEVNALADEHYQSTFGIENVYELRRSETDRGNISQHIGGRYLFPKPATYDTILNRFQSGARVTTVKIKDVQATQDAIPEKILPFFVIPDEEHLIIWAEENPPRLQKGMRLISMIDTKYYDDLIEQDILIEREDLEAESSAQQDGVAVTEG